MAKKIGTGQPGPQDDQSLAEELESLYCRVARLDDAAASGEERDRSIAGGLHAPARTAAVPGDIGSLHSRGEIRAVDHHSPNQQDALAGRLNRIADAYEEILSLSPPEENQSPSTPAGDEDRRPSTCQAERNAPPQDRVPMQAGRSLLRRYPWSVGSAATAALILFLVFVCPTPYRHGAVTGGNRVYPETDRLTAHSSSFDGTAWLISPLPTEQEPASARGSRPVQARQAETATPPALAVPAIGDPGPPSAERSDAPPKPSSPRSPAASSPESGAVLPAVSPEKRMDPSIGAKGAPGRGGRYSIQIKAFRNEQDARSFAELVGRTEPGIQIETVHLEGSGVWHRVLMGEFRGEQEALDYSAAKRTKELYPGSFIRESPLRRGRE